MKVVERVLRWYSYFRRGYSLYVSFPLGYIQFIIVVYALALANISFLKDWFPHLSHFAVFTIIVVGSVSVLSGYWDYKKGSVITDNVLMTKSNPITWDTVEASIKNSEALRDFILSIGMKFDLDVSEPVKKINESIEIFKRWKK